jgi:hypothetical protein
VTAGGAHAGIQRAGVTVFDLYGHPITTAVTKGKTGAFKVSGLMPSTSRTTSNGITFSQNPIYLVCFNGLAATHTATGYLPRCWVNGNWNGTSDVKFKPPKSAIFTGPTRPKV